MQEYKPGFKMDKKMKLVLHHPSEADLTSAGLVHRYTELLKKLDLAANEQAA